MHDAPDVDDGFEKTLANLLEHYLTAQSFLSVGAADDYALFKTAFIQALSSETHLEKLILLPSLRTQDPPLSVPVMTLLIRLWTDLSMAQTARATALRCLQRLIKAKVEHPLQSQFLLPYLIAGLADKSSSVRQSAAEATLAVSECVNAEHKHKAKGDKEFRQQTYDWQPLPEEVMKHFLDSFLVPNLEEATLDPSNVIASIARQLSTSTESKKSRKVKASLSAQICDFLASHAAKTTVPSVKLTLLKIVNGAGSEALHAQEDILAPALKQSLVSPLQVVDADNLKSNQEKELQIELFRTIGPDSKAGLSILASTLSEQTIDVRPDVVHCAYGRLIEIWEDLSPEASERLAGLLVDATLRNLEMAKADLYHDLASGTIRNLKLPGHVLVKLVDGLPNALNMPDAPPATKRRRTSRSEKARLAAVEPADLSAALAKYTLVLELVENNRPAEHPELLQGLFRVLEELQNFRLQIQSGLVYLQGLTIGCLLAIVDKLKMKKNTTLDASSIRPDLIVDCIRHSTNAQVQSTALLLISSLSSWQPDTVVHSIMPIFTFMGNTILRQGDEYSAHVTDKTVSRVVPPLVESFRKKNKDIVVGASSLLLSFTAAFEHIPLHRRLALFEHVARTVGPQESLYALIAMLIDAYPTDARAKRFVAELLNQFEPSVSLKTIRKCLDLVWDIFRSRRTISNHVLNMSERPKDTHDNVAANLLIALAELLNDRQLRGQMSKSFESGDIDSANAQRMACVELIQEAIRLSQFLKSKPDLAQPAANVLSSIVNLLPTIELVQCSETLLAQKDDEVRLVAISSVLSRAREVSNPGSDDVSSLLGFMSKLTSLLSEPDNVALCSQAITCAGQIIKRFGKKDTGVVVAAAQVISSEHALKNADLQVRVASMVCLTVVVKVLKDEFIPLMPQTLPAVFEYLRHSLSSQSAMEATKLLLLSTACFAFVHALTENLPFLITGESLDTILQLLVKAGTSEFMDAKLKDSRSDLYRLLAKNIEADELFSAFERNFQTIVKTGGFEVSSRTHKFIEYRHSCSIGFRGVFRRNQTRCHDTAEILNHPKCISFVRAVPPSVRPQASVSGARFERF
jgi:U3 small nucleolar RNA-associated protein 10